MSEKKLANGVPKEQSESITEVPPTTNGVVPEQARNGEQETSPNKPPAGEEQAGGRQPEKQTKEATTTATTTTTTSAAKEEEGAPPEYNEEEDLLDYELECNGSCTSPVVGRWLPGLKFYSCMDCEDTDLCVSCHAIQMDYFDRHGEGFWFKCCWARHTFLEVPIAGWRGVKDGVIRVGDKEKPYGDWLDAVKNKWAKKMSGGGDMVAAASKT